jgi:prepilin-type processing-associated H-X9-DG protein
MRPDPTVLEYATQKPRKPRYVLIVILGSLAVSLGLIWTMLPPFSRTHVISSRGISAANLQLIGEMCYLYANENQDHGLPSDIGILTTAEDLTPEAVQSPWSQRLSPPSTQPAVLVPWVNQHCDYTYLGAGKLASQLTQKDVLGHEKWWIAKQNGGMNILFGDGHVEWFNLADAAKLLIPSPASAPASKP